MMKDNKKTLRKLALIAICGIVFGFLMYNVGRLVGRGIYILIH